jgi:hypothetical protein
MAPVPRTYSPNDIENQTGRTSTAANLLRDEARRIAVNIAEIKSPIGLGAPARSMKVTFRWPMRAEGAGGVKRKAPARWNRG